MKQLKWKAVDNFITTTIIVDVKGFKYDFDVYIDVAFDKKAHEEYSFIIHAYGIQDKPIITKKSAKTLSFNKCMSWVYAGIRKIVDTELTKAEAKYFGYIDAMAKLTIEQEYYESNQTLKNPLCEKLIPLKQAETKTTKKIKKIKKIKEIK